MHLNLKTFRKAPLGPQEKTLTIHGIQAFIDTPNGPVEAPAASSEESKSMLEVDSFDIPTMFKRLGKEGGFQVIPEFAEGCEWAISPAESGSEGKFLCIKLDGALCRIKDQMVFRKLGNALVPVTPDGPEDQYIMKAYGESAGKYKLPDGYYVAIGPQINNNPQRVARHQMIRIAPVDANLMVNWSTVDIKRGSHISIGEFYNSIRATLTDSTVQGFVFLWEKPVMRPYKLCQVTRRDFGLEWPIKVVEEKETVTML